jgi:hypothetical protein
MNNPTTDEAPIRGDGRGRLDCAASNFPECQYVANGTDPATAVKLGWTYRAGNSIGPIGHDATDRISNRLNQIQSQRFPLRK